MFQVKDFRSILAGMVNLVRGATDQLTDFRPGSVTRTLLEAPAGEIAALYLEMFHGITEAIPVAIYGAFDFERLPAIAAYGDVVFSREAPVETAVTIPVGTRMVTASGTQYETTAPAVLAAGEAAVAVSARCVFAGAAGNVAAGTLTSMASWISGIDAVTNPAAMSTGRDEETDEERKARFAAYIKALPRGTVSAVSYGAGTARLFAEDGTVAEYVREVAVLEEFVDDPTKPVGFVRVVISSGTGGASEDLVNECQRVIDGYLSESGEPVPGWKAAGVIATVESAVEVPVAVTATITGDGTVSHPALVAACEAAIGDYLSTRGLGDDVLASGLTVALATVPGVYNVDLTTPAADVPIDEHEIAIPGVVAIS